MKFVLASHNRKKLAEMQEILGELGVEVVLQSDVGLDLEPEENGTTFAENAAIKAMAVMQASGLPAIADDSGLCVDALNGAPGIYSARYGGEGLDDRGRYTLLLENMRGQSPRTARFEAHEIPLAEEPFFAHRGSEQAARFAYAEASKQEDGASVSNADAGSAHLRNDLYP